MVEFILTTVSIASLPQNMDRERSFDKEGSEISMLAERERKIRSMLGESSPHFDFLSR